MTLIDSIKETEELLDKPMPESPQWLVLETTLKNQYTILKNQLTIMEAMQER